jgi:starvation-inducible DNA-binding protein
MKPDIAIGDNARKQVATALRGVLADTFVLYAKTHGFHWNVVGPDFSQLHAFFEEQYRALWDALDELAERIRALGELAPASLAEMQESHSLKESTGQPNSKQMLKQLLEGHEGTIKTVRSCLETAEKGGDEVTVDLMVERLTYHEKTAWMLRAHLEGDK